MHPQDSYPSVIRAQNLGYKGRKPGSALARPEAVTFPVLLFFDQVEPPVHGHSLRWSVTHTQSVSLLLGSTYCPFHDSFPRFAVPRSESFVVLARTLVAKGSNFRPGSRADLVNPRKGKTIGQEGCCCPRSEFDRSGWLARPTQMPGREDFEGPPAAHPEVLAYSGLPSVGYSICHRWSVGCD